MPITSMLSRLASFASLGLSREVFFFLQCRPLYPTWKKQNEELCWLNWASREINDGTSGNSCLATTAFQPSYIKDLIYLHSTKQIIQRACMYHLRRLNLNDSDECSQEWVYLAVFTPLVAYRSWQPSASSRSYNFWILVCIKDLGWVWAFSKSVTFLIHFYLVVSISFSSYHRVKNFNPWSVWL